MKGNNIKSKLIFNFFLWILFWILIAVLSWYINIDLSKSVDSQFAKVTDNSILNNVLSWLNNIKLGNSSINYSKYDKFEFLQNELEKW
jgi:CHASE3 domain sensor protein